jgi:hypothetical protein
MVSPAELPGPAVRGVGENFESKSVPAAKFSRKNRHRIYRIIDSARKACTRPAELDPTSRWLRCPEIEIGRAPAVAKECL